MNEYQNKLLELAKEYIRVCEKLGLSYFAIGGTCLGAIRHNGFIPWDDDMDFGMPRNDYEVFEKEAPKHLPKNYFVQTHNTDKKYIYPFMKIRDSETTAIEDELKKIKINQGVWIDVFPMDGLPDDAAIRKKIEKKDRQIIRRRFLLTGYQKSFLDFAEKVLSIIMFPSKRLALKTSINISKKYDFYSTKYFWWNWGSRTDHNFEASWFMQFDNIKFESITIRVPHEYEKYLCEHYGDWKKIPPLNKRNSGHVFYFIDLNKSYKNYLK